MDFTLTPEQKELQAIARKFARERVAPRSREADREPDPAKAWPADLFREASKLGLRTITLPREHGGRGADTLTELIVLEELCAGDLAFGSSLAHPWREGLILADATTPEQRERYLKPFLADDDGMTALAITEPHAGTDNASGYDADLGAGPVTSAVLDGDEWVINGKKIFITAGNVAKIMILIARTDPTVPWRRGISAFIFPTDTPGYRCLSVMDKLGMRPNPNTELVFENCRIPASNLIGKRNEGLAVLAKYGKSSKVKEAVKSLGCARAAYEEAAIWCNSRVQGGKKIIGHQSVRHRLVDILGDIEMCRSLCWRAGWACDHDADAIHLQTLAKIKTCEMAARVTVQLLELFGGYGILSFYKPFYPAKYVRDAVTMLHTTGGSDGLRDGLADILFPHEGGTGVRGAWA
jgi:alkylation response protein AidB-like acyl-CoA dehydrogenase